MKRIILSVFAAAVTAAWAIPASAGDVTFSGQYRLRGEYTNNNNFNDAVSDDSDSWTQRVRLTANAKATDDVSAKITLQDTRTWGQNGAGSLLTDVSGINNTVDLHEAYVNVSDIFGAPVSLRAGRQELAYGDERLVGAFGWSPNGRAFDAFKLMFSNDAVNVDLFSATINEAGAAGAGAAGDDTYFNGIYATLKQIVPNNTLDLYVLNLNGQSSNATSHYTLGTRIKGAVAGVDYTGEFAYQTGDLDTTPTTPGDGTTDLAAYAFAVKAGYTLPTPLKIRVGAEYDYATGADSDTAENEAFQNLFPTNHAHFGIGDVVNSWSDIQAWSVNASADLNEKLRLYVAYWDYTEQETATGESDDLGSEIDVVATYKYNNNVSIEVGAARYMPGDGRVTTTTPAPSGIGSADPGPLTPDDARDWAYLQITANF